MKALVYHGPGAKAWEDVANPSRTFLDKLIL